MDSDQSSQSEVEEIPVDEDKITILPGFTKSSITFSIKEEDHTLGNSLRYVIMKNPDVEFCGYSLPHPSEDKLHLRIQMYDDKCAIQAFFQGLDALEGLVNCINESFQTELLAGNYERFREPTVQERLDQIKAKKYPHLLNQASKENEVSMEQ
ncbi:DNA-directed RNA polymerase III subunit C19 [Phakopsora pachyrhizi]|uniref:DNA-directed RNA polymerases I and III subunit RPAC2 n=1 Tax=Phakopsora pachyrhizi TaxID=170000 RepID=A0AAV0BKT8_PHAPC|nr:DNA-directed RNA polymerase III subunit C19 [Phakopsora pachyrhizi]CAH7687937.1 DNA-directed RNA polymerase III subunit C19 [Phakopsora pachyrhizi]